ncbi:phosphomannomutase/phosphoglucomutase [Desulforegula conservatrix]|uniref:phosphomannomutase/phosphoglucomutase n=1 Tax=Desulforegula conservatrix TaxID=153026 RepID=UPI0004280CAA|nr:phosphomannomutase/phosphoglucomutase [Desulforegula conservatrix]
MNPGIFREYDIRGIAGEDLTEDDVINIGKAAGTYLIRHGCRRIMVGRDCRLTSNSYTEKLKQGLMSTGCDVVDIGICPTPVLYFSIRHFKAEGGIMVTASHNPPEYNGFKMCRKTDSVHGEDLKKIRDLILAGDYEKGSGKAENADAVTPYKSYLLGNIKLNRKLKIGLDAGNGTGGVVGVPVLRELGCEVHDIYCDMDGTFPNHEADPTVLKNLKDLIELVKKEKLDAGIGFDGDSDRIGVISEKGDIIYGDQLLVIFSREILSRRPGATFISEVKCSQVMYDDIEKNGGNAIMWKTGHSLIKEKMKTEKAALAGEMSGHMFFEDRYFGYDDAIYAACRLLEIMSNTDRKLSDLISDLPKTFNTPEIRVDCPDDKKFQTVEKAKEYFRSKHKIIDIDGARVLFDDGWGLVRASNTQPALVLRFEALSEPRLDEIRNYMEGIVKELSSN